MGNDGEGVKERIVAANEKSKVFLEAIKANPGQFEAVRENVRAFVLHRFFLVEEDPKSEDLGELARLSLSKLSQVNKSGVLQDLSRQLRGSEFGDDEEGPAHHDLAKAAGRAVRSGGKRPHLPDRPCHREGVGQGRVLLDASRGAQSVRGLGAWAVRRFEGGRRHLAEAAGGRRRHVRVSLHGMRALQGGLKGAKPFGTCLSCGFENPAGTTRCARCGAPLGRPQARPFRSTSSGLQTRDRGGVLARWPRKRESRRTRAAALSRAAFAGIAGYRKRRSRNLCGSAWLGSRLRHNGRGVEEKEPHDIRARAFNHHQEPVPAASRAGTHCRNAFA